ncbi:hypothetical protein RI129_002417 [Pyrocoelia pectoralis]|uniref:Uncharacterized protein n=1 Tax=Pyrocoelia pectoralis TaxID=417401 RepID=A0AAN7ZHX9_9COLE
MNSYIILKKVLILTGIAALAYSQKQLGAEDLGDFSANEMKCIKDHNINVSKVTLLLKQPYIPENDFEMNDFMECTWKLDGLLHNNGSVAWQPFYFYVKGAYIDAVGMTELADFFANDTINHCKDNQGKTPGQVAVLLLNCVIRKLYV